MKTRFGQTLPKTIEPYAARVADYDDERAAGRGIFVGYERGWKSGEGEGVLGPAHYDSAANVKEALSMIRNAKPCNCVECR